MLQLENSTALQATLAAMPDLDGVDSLVVTVKGSFSLLGDLDLLPDQQPIVAADVHWGDPESSSVRYGSEFHLPKPGTDVALVGSAWTTHCPQPEWVDVRLTVAERSLAARVFGDRFWEARLFGLRASRPQPFTSLPLTYERAFGGQRAHPKGGEPELHPRNPVGRGFAHKRSARQMAGQALPNIEDPNGLLISPGQTPDPVCFGFVAPSWLPRTSYAGTYDDAWTTTRAPYLPEDFDPRFFQAAHPDLTFDRFLEGGERVIAENLSESGRLDFRLPQIAPRIGVHTRGAMVHPEVALETVLLEPDEDRLVLVWRALVSCDKSILKIDRVTVDGVRGAQPREAG